MEVNTRVNYPVKKALIEMENSGDIHMGDPLCKYCVSWFTIEVLTVGTKFSFSLGTAILFQVMKLMCICTYNIQWLSTIYVQVEEGVEWEVIFQMMSCIETIK